MTRADVIALARRGPAGESEILRVLAAAKATNNRFFLGVCLDCFRSVLEDSLSDAAGQVVQHLSELLVDPAYRRIRPRVLRTLAWIGRASHVALPQLVATFLRRGRSSLLVPARAAVVHVAYRTLVEGNPAERANAIAAFEQLGSLGLLNLRHCLAAENPDPATRSLIEGAISRLKLRYPNS